MDEHNALAWRDRWLFSEATSRDEVDRGVESRQAHAKKLLASGKHLTVEFSVAKPH